MDEMLSQEEINALLNGLDESSDNSNLISDDEKDAIGEISNISMGTAATTLFTLVNHKVVITTPTVSVSNWDELSKEFFKPCIAIQIIYKEGLEGTNLLMLREDDVKIITDLMMGGDGENPESELSELHLSAISEAMNQMIGSSATSMSSMFNKKIDINPPTSNIVDFNQLLEGPEFANFLGKDFLKVSFKMQIGDLVDSEMMQLYPIEFAKEIYESFIEGQKAEKNKSVKQPKQVNQTTNATQQAPVQPQNNMQQPGFNQPLMQQNPMNNQGFMNNNEPSTEFRNVDVQPAQFQQFDMGAIMQQKENIDLIMDVPLEVTVELGRTSKSIKEILEFTPGTILELKKLAGEPIDVLVNGKYVAKGEVVVIDENFGIRITDIVKHNGQIL